MSIQQKVANDVEQTQFFNAAHQCIRSSTLKLNKIIIKKNEILGIYF